MYALFFFAVIGIQGIFAQFDSCIAIVPPVHPNEARSVPEAFIRAGIVDDYIPVPPSDMLMGGHENHELRLGSYVSPLATLSPLEISYPNGEDSENYAVFLLGVDAPSSNYSANTAFINGMFVNSPASDISQGDEVVPFSPAIPFPDGKMHRFVGLLYKQNGIMDPDSMELLKLARNRNGFSVTDFAEKHGLGDPLAGNFFYSSLSSCDLQ